MGSGYLHQDDVVFYHPCDDLIEHKEGKTWTNYGDNLYFTNGVLVSGVTRTANYHGRLESTDNVYPGCSGDTSWTFACWVKDDTADSQEMWAGWYNGEGYDNLLRLYLSGPTSMQIKIVAGGESDTFTAKTRSPTGSGLYIIHVEFYGTTASGWMSHNGSGWISCGEVDVYQPDEQYDRVMCGKYNYTGKEGNAVLDEAIFWHNTSQFTDIELLNLYNLFYIHGLAMDQYSTVGTPVNHNIDLFLHGYEQTSGNIDFYIPGQLESSSIDLYICGPRVINSGIDNSIYGHNTLIDDIDQYIEGHQTTSGDITLSISGLPIISTSVDLYIAGPIPLSGNIDHFIWGHLPISGDFSLFVRGSAPDINAFVAVTTNNPSDSLDLFVYGATLATSGVLYTNDTMTLFINDSGEDTTVDSDWSAFTRVADPFLISYSDTWQSFVKGGNVVNDTIDLYLYGHASGDNPHGTPITDSLDVFIEGAGDLLSADYSTINKETSVFTKVHLGAINMLDLYVSGETPIIQPSATLGLFTFGILDTTSGSSILHTIGKQSFDSTCNLFVFGIQDVVSGNLTLYLEVTDVGSFNQTGDFYTHGY